MATTVFCPICKAPFDYSQRKQHIALHKSANDEELQQLMKLIKIFSNSRSNSYIKTSSRIDLKDKKVISSTDLLRKKKQHIMSNSTVSGGAFGQGKK